MERDGARVGAGRPSGWRLHRDGNRARRGAEHGDRQQFRHRWIPPRLRLDINGGSFLDDAILNVSESLTDQTLGGTTTAGATVQLVVGTQTLTTVAGTDGTWSITIPAAQLQALDNGPQDLTLTVTTPTGNTSTVPLPVTVGNDTVPTLAIGTVFTDGLINLSEIQNGGVISGTSTGLPEGTPITIALGGITLNGKVGAGGAWQITADADALDALQNGQYTLTVTAQDQYGNPATAAWRWMCCARRRPRPCRICFLATEQSTRVKRRSGSS